ncbi:hypothetical protein E3P81_03187 [Wallemia ichthyophaga]|nr:hypothetical protein E3P97_03267 [Wallemia ichthyophaga]TIB30008.1 hypothetical protein E3P85_02897 [Wallemia ichthyophaga]TIB44980.1 hypothetical protein E3P82_03230 [Wallemia ichthyophaga]TIB47635.1 hypothetical protein E3P81_03187 [Wallemia ichthyophaga]TIB50761.1 hypothetical protein E3P80_03196 [Wallemia ichthyophaga]
MQPRSTDIVKSNQPLYAYTLPDQLLQRLKLRSVGAQDEDENVDAGSEEDDEQDAKNEPGEERTTPRRKKYFCSTTQASFDTIEELRMHFHSDWYRYCVKLKADGKDPVTEEAFEDMLDDVSSSSDEDGDEDKLTQLLRKQTKLNTLSNSKEDDVEDFDTQRALSRTPVVWFEVGDDNLDDATPGAQLGVYRALFPSPTPPNNEILDHLNKFQLNDSQLNATDSPRRWTLIMIGGGHFAACVVSIVPQVVRRNKMTEVDIGVVLKQKTFHRYTTRRKQGGSQSSNDMAKGKANSAGAMIRRYNEQALAEDVRALMNEWKDDIDGSERIFVRATSSSNRRILFGGANNDDCVIKKTDPRIRGFPFPTRRPTHNELIRCFQELTKVKTTYLTRNQLREQDEDWLAKVVPKPKVLPSQPQQQTAQPEKPRALTAEEEEEIFVKEVKSRAIEMVSKDRLEALKTHMDRHSGILTNPSIIMENGSTLLQIAAANNSHNVVTWLLLEKQVDPAVFGGNKTAYELSKGKESRDAFRIAMGKLPERWDWVEGARVPSSLTQEQLEQSSTSAREKERRKNLKDRMKEKRGAREQQEVKQREEEEAKEKERIAKIPSHATTNTLGGNANTLATAGLSGDLKIKVERERRARAAEARMANITKN